MYISVIKKGIVYDFFTAVGNTFVKMNVFFFLLYFDSYPFILQICELLYDRTCMNYYSIMAL